MIADIIRHNGRYFCREIMVLKVTGVSLTGNEGIFYKMYSGFVLLMVYVVYEFLDVLELFKQDIDEILDILIYVVGIGVSASKIGVLLWNRNKLIKLLRKLHREPFAVNFERGGKTEEKLLNQCISITTFQTTAYWITAVFCVAIGTISCVTIRLRSSDYHDWQFIYGPLSPINTSYSPNYELVWLYQTVTIATIAMHFCTSDLLVAAVLCHASFQFKILHNCIKVIVEKAQHEMLKNSVETAKDYEMINPTWKYLKKPLRQAIRYHLSIIEIVEEMEDVFSILLLIVFLGTLGMLSFEVYHASTIHDVRLVKNVMEFITLVSQILLSCYWGEQVYVEAEKVGMAIYKSNFVGSDLRYQKAIVLIARRSRNGVGLTAGKFVEVRLTTFAWVIRTSFSAFMVLQKVNE